MKPRQKYVRLTESQILVLPKHKTFVTEYSDQRGISINQAIRDIIDHAMTCSFFNGNGIANGNIAPVVGE